MNELACVRVFCVLYVMNAAQKAHAMEIIELFLFSNIHFGKGGDHNTIHFIHVLDWISFSFHFPSFCP